MNADNGRDEPFINFLFYIGFQIQIMKFKIFAILSLTLFQRLDYAGKQYMYIYYQDEDYDE